MGKKLLHYDEELFYLLSILNVPNKKWKTKSTIIIYRVTSCENSRSLYADSCWFWQCLNFHCRYQGSILWICQVEIHTTTYRTSWYGRLRWNQPSHISVCYFVSQVEAVLNSRPLCCCRDGEQDDVALTPDHFLTEDHLLIPSFSPTSTSWFSSR